MFALNTLTMSILVAVVAALAVLAILVWRRRHRMSPAERERGRRLAVNAAGRLTDGALIEVPTEHDPEETRGLIFYRYRAAGLEYTAAQDVSTLLNPADVESFRSGNPVIVKYDPRRPSNSIVICETWSGFRDLQKEDDPLRKLLARQR